MVITREVAAGKRGVEVYGDIPFRSAELISQLSFVQEVIFFGRLARGHGDERSDIDICVVVDERTYIGDAGCLEVIIKILNENGILAGSSSRGDNKGRGSVDVMLLSDVLVKNARNGHYYADRDNGWLNDVAYNGKVLWVRSQGE